MKNGFEKRHTYFEVRSPADAYGLMGQYESEKHALDAINESYRSALIRGYDNSYETWIIVCNEVVKVFDDGHDFLKSEVIRYVVASAQYDEYEKAFVFAY